MKPRPASTVVLVRESSEQSDTGNGTAGQLETLLLLRNTKLTFMGGTWVFPGGKVDPGDYPADCEQLPGPHADYLAAINAVVRETREEAGLTIAPADLIHIAHWTTPAGLPRRYATWFFLCPLREQAEVVIDDEEILDYQWMSPELALQRHARREISLPQPTAHTLRSLVAHCGLTALCEEKRCGGIHVFPENSEDYHPVGYPVGAEWLPKS
tara:strand:+ start:13169 stop:13804 length:636 start_codon:yes stop_codon:yes gene_type:complete